ncbi:DUF2723 domain-containing protein [Rubrobacter radiotolerans]|uniref:DUF2723 domain-containing protein n=1 Tax=Rubrobacter radiotolerans TaxID=42256 RepID=A0AB35T1T1_RUBRA|nr:DUF2723 domain-containing protein [Rubrobacter radiotolerans]MDX5893527.1 DUF2723 domain-containing protein [Rubrobacter radiotolerans]
MSFLAGLAVSLGTFLLYLSTLAPTVLYYDLPELRDSAVLQTRAYVLGIPDYTGYPTYIMLAHLFTYLPFGDVGYRVNLASAVYAAAAVGLVYAGARTLCLRTLPSAAGALAFGLSPLLWSQAVIAEVYTLNALLVAAPILTLLLWWRSRRDRYLLVFAFLAALALTNHITSGLVLLGAFVLVAFTEWRKLLDLRLLVKGAGLFLAGLVPYAYLPVRASMDYLPDGVEWGQPLVRRHPPDTLYGFYNLVSGGTWKERMWAFGPAELPGRVALYGEHLIGGSGQFGPLGFVVVLVALVGTALLLARRSHRPVGAMLLVFWSGWTLYALEYDIEDIEYYFIPTYLVISLALAAGLAELLDVFSGLPEGRRRPRSAGYALVALIGLLPLLGAGDSYAKNDMSEDYRGREIMAAVAENAEPNATVLHHRSPLDYLLFVENRRRDLKLIAYLEEPNPYGAALGILESREAPTYVLFPGYTSTPYYSGVGESRRLYERYGYRLVPVDRDVHLYRVARAGLEG